MELAVRGLLVPQDSNDEPASVLLEKIAVEKEQLIKSGKLKKQKPMPPIGDDEKIFELPKGWEWERFGNIYELEYGDSLPKAKRSNTGEYPVYGSNGVVGTHSEYCISKPCVVVGRKGSAGALNLNKGEGCWVTDVAYSIVPPKSLLLTYVFLKLHTLNLDALGKGIKPGLNRNEAYQLCLALPPEAEQPRIVAKVDELMALCDQLEQQQENSLSAHQTLVATLLAALTSDNGNITHKADANTATSFFESAWARIEQHFDTLFTTEASIEQLKQTILQLAVMGKLVPQDPNDEPASVLLEKIATEKEQLIKDKKIKKQKLLPQISDDEKPFELPCGWEWCNLQSLITIMDAGWSPACPPEPSPSNDIWGVLKTTAVQSMEYREYENKVLAANKEPRPQYEVKVGDILITRAGPKNRVGVSCLVQATRPKLMISDKVIRFHLVEMGMCERYLSLCLNAGATADYLDSTKSGMAESQMNISQDKLKAAPVPLPPAKEQFKIVKRVDELIALCDTLKTCISKSQSTQLHLADAMAEQALN